MGKASLIRRVGNFSQLSTNEWRTIRKKLSDSSASNASWCATCALSSFCQDVLWLLPAASTLLRTSGGDGSQGLILAEEREAAKWAFDVFIRIRGKIFWQDDENRIFQLIARSSSQPFSMEKLCCAAFATSRRDGRGLFMTWSWSFCVTIEWFSSSEVWWATVNALFVCCEWCRFLSAQLPLRVSRCFTIP